MQRLFLIVIILQCAFISKAQEPKYNFKPTFCFAFDSINGQALLHQCSRATTPKTISSYWNVTLRDMDQLYSNFKKIYAITSTACCHFGMKLKSLDRCIFQCTGVIMGKKKYIYINACGYSEESINEENIKAWKIHPLIVCDGGSSYWGVLFSIDNREFSHLAFNGEG